MAALVSAVFPLDLHGWSQLLQIHLPAEALQICHWWLHLVAIAPGHFRPNFLSQGPWHHPWPLWWRDTWCFVQRRPGREKQAALATASRQTNGIIYLKHNHTLKQFVAPFLWPTQFLFNQRTLSSFKHFVPNPAVSSPQRHSSWIWEICCDAAVASPFQSGAKQIGWSFTARLQVPCRAGTYQAAFLGKDRKELLTHKTISLSLSVAGCKKKMLNFLISA